MYFRTSLVATHGLYGPSIMNYLKSSSTEIPKSLQICPTFPCYTRTLKMSSGRAKIRRASSAETHAYVAHRYAPYFPAGINRTRDPTAFRIIRPLVIIRALWPFTAAWLRRSAGREVPCARAACGPVFCDTRVNVAFNDITRDTAEDLMILRCSLTPYAGIGASLDKKYKRLRKYDTGRIELSSVKRGTYNASYLLCLRAVRARKRKKKKKKNRKESRQSMSNNFHPACANIVRSLAGSRRIFDACVECNIHSKKFPAGAELPAVVVKVSHFATPPPTMCK